MDKNANALNWFEIPANDINRAKAFYSKVMDAEMGEIEDYMGSKMCYFPSVMGNGKVSGSLVQSPEHIPSTQGSVIYLNANPSIQAVIDRVEPAGGKVLMPKMEISPEIGCMAFFIDSEGNKVALHAQN